jgi:hypothetical protein
MTAVANKSIPVVPDTGTEKAARPAAELTGNPGCWVRLACGHPRHVQHMVPAAAMVDCPTWPPSVDGGQARRRVVGVSSEHHCNARLAADPHAAATARRLTAEAVTAAGLNAVLGDAVPLDRPHLAALIGGALGRRRGETRSCGQSCVVMVGADFLALGWSRLLWAEDRGGVGRAN